MNFDVILADPPWSFKVWSEKGKGKSPKYDVMDLNEICNLPVNELTNPNCALFMWITWPFVTQAERVMNAWGFTYRTCAFLWVKANRKGEGFFTGTGYYTRANTEACLLGVKGKMSVASHSVSQVIYSPVRKHSQKPDEQYGNIETLYPGVSYLELFAREKRPGWKSWGNEIQSDIELLV